MRAKTSTNGNIKTSDITELVTPLPPLAEQKRIVAKIEELLPHIDRYEQAWSKLENFNKRFPTDMQKSILQLAIQGKLVDQRPEEGTGEELYQQIQAEKQRLIKAGAIKKEKPLPEITEDEIPFDIPDTWKWVKLGDCSSYAQTKEKVSPIDITGDMWSLDLEDIQKETGAIIAKIKASERTIAGDKVKFHKGQVLYSKLRPYLKKILVALDDGICTPELVPFSTYLVDANFVAYVLRSPHIDYVINSVTYGVKMPRVGTDTMINLLIPLPPLAEQKRIIAKLEEILPLCEQLK
jgi:type I restriction enzyme S subunit